MFINDTLICPKCKKPSFVKAKDFEAGFYVCSNKLGLGPCGAKNLLSFYFDESITKGLPKFGSLVAQHGSKEKSPLSFGTNILGRGMQAGVRLEASATGVDGRPLMSRLHATLVVSFNKYEGKLMYELSDGAVDSATNQKSNSVNFTFRDNKKLEPSESVFIEDGAIIKLGEDKFKFEAYFIPTEMLETYKKQFRSTDSSAESTT